MLAYGQQWRNSQDAFVGVRLITGIVMNTIVMNMISCFYCKNGGFGFSAFAFSAFAFTHKHVCTHARARTCVCTHAFTNAQALYGLCKHARMHAHTNCLGRFWPSNFALSILDCKRCSQHALQWTPSAASCILKLGSISLKSCLLINSTVMI